MHAGIDFGTSNCLISTSRDGEVQPLPLTGQTAEMPSALYVLKAAVAAQSIEDPRNLEMLARRIGRAKVEQTTAVAQAKEEYARWMRRYGDDDSNKQHKPTSWKEFMTTRIMTDTEIESRIRTVMQRELLAQAGETYAQQGMAKALSAGDETTYGTEATEQSLVQSDDGFYIKSPKSFLGARLPHARLEVFKEVCSRMLGHIRTTAEQHTQEPIESVVIGRPVNFHGKRGEEGNRQAVGILEAAAKKAGYKDVEFMLEPVAAAIDFERTLLEDHTVLVVDLGGGTTDCTVLKLGPSYRQTNGRSRVVLAHTGDRIGGLDLDIQLAFDGFMPAFGKGTSDRSGLPVANHLFWDACAVNDLPAQDAFLRADLRYIHSRAAEPGKLSKLLALQQSKAMLWLSLSAEEAKIALSEAEAHVVKLSYISPGFSIETYREAYEAAIERQLATFSRLAHEAVLQAGTQPSLVYVTGGTAKSPIIRRSLQTALGKDTEIISGNLFSGVVSGLAVHSEAIYRPTPVGA
ncbi:molecular chaperone [Halomonas sp. McH1-25]|uniref:molecular chaperone n=1 Tax=unclassified Halomonas TaxID=2609666 RepID=UPI001EF3DFDD|nr:MULTISPECIES: molecular chaperone [unclassified Halomonas]MCG7602047.1 molecular chaperone [Halomonas sp. McH1-25]MCP1342883.1 molecular chaperone [Halomonas sp. FL8]MCP1361678.1 molecular chaperone [Halomonas sp. BBD45]MCP1363625.1 molecular chaperone [Halomonas sp. BBD48]